MTDSPSWGSSIPILFDIRGTSVWLVCVECFEFQLNITGGYVSTAYAAAIAHIQEAHP